MSEKNIELEKAKALVQADMIERQKATWAEVQKLLQERGFQLNLSYDLGGQPIPLNLILQDKVLITLTPIR